MTGLAWALAGSFGALALLHVHWGLGGIWPARDEASLARAVVGAPGIRKMPPAIACFTVAVLLGAAGVWPLFQAGLVSTPLPRWITTPAGMGLAFVFLARGVAGYLPAWRRMTPEQPFAALDRALYAPICLALGFGAAALLLMR